MFHSIRRRLPLSYAAIALLAALVLGAVLLLILRDHYTRVERDYLRSNAQAIGFSLAQLIEDDQPVDVLQTELDSFSFLSGTRVRLFDSGGQVVASSSPEGDYRVAFAPAGEGEPRLPLLDGRSVIVIQPGAVASPAITTTREALWLKLPGFEERLRVLAPVRGTVPFFLPAQSATSSHVIQMPIYGTGDKLLGFVELSQGPSYAREIVRDVSRGWGVASAVAVILAAAAGWLASRRISTPLLALTGVTASMAGGELSARADASRRDEFGTLARAFNAMADRVEETVTSLRRFVSDAAHELNTPLTTLRTNLELVYDDSPPEQRTRIARAQDQVQRLEVLTTGMLDLSRIEAGMRRARAGPVSLSTLAREMGELYASRAEQLGLAFELSLPETPVTVRGDEGQLRQALTNLLDNAVKFTPAGGHIQMGLRPEGDTAVVWVEDTGIGIPEADLPLLFQRFHRGRNTEGFPGSGLGLAIVKAVADEHNGQVRAERTGKGSRFALQMPLGSAR